MCSHVAEKPVQQTRHHHEEHEMFLWMNALSSKMVDFSRFCKRDGLSEIRAYAFFWRERGGDRKRMITLVTKTPSGHFKDTFERDQIVPVLEDAVAEKFYSAMNTWGIDPPRLIHLLDVHEPWPD